MEWNKQKIKGLLLVVCGGVAFYCALQRLDAVLAALGWLPVAAAALLLAGFTDQWQALVIGCNLGGLGTLIASMASLISYKLIVAALPEVRGRYFRWFTASNIGMLALLLAAWAGLTPA